jgi:LEA14-like dessication related protein
MVMTNDTVAIRLPRACRALALLLIGMMTGCAGLPSGMEPPAVTISDLGLGNAGLLEQQFNLRLRIQNPNSQELKIDGMAFDLEINDQLFAQGVGNAAVTVPRYGSGFMPVEAVSTLGGLLKQFNTLARGDKPVFKYRIKGTLSVDGRRIPFERHGEFDLSALSPKKST